MILLPKSSIEYNFEKIKEKFETEFGTIIYEEQYKHLILKCIQQVILFYIYFERSSYF